MTKEYLYPVWLRIWHWFNALLFVVLILTGISMHYSNSNELFISFELSMIIHNTAGVILSLNYLAFLIFNMISGNYKHYIPVLKGLFNRLIIQAKYYAGGIFRGEEHPYESSSKNKFNPLQQLTYIGIMYFFMPVIVITGILLMFPELAPDKILGMGGVWPMAILHLASGFFLTLFMIGHIYLATTGETVTANFKAMVDGWHRHSSHKDEKETNFDNKVVDNKVTS